MRKGSAGVIRRRAIVFLAVVVAALATAAVASANWTWGYNYLGNSTDNHVCPSFMPHPGSVCGADYFTKGGLDQNAGGTQTWGYANSSSFSGWVYACCWLDSRTPQDAGFGGGYLYDGGYWVANAAVYVYMWGDT